jgi:tetratricopeptide (TPR) repeat protein
MLSQDSPHTGAIGHPLLSSSADGISQYLHRVEADPRNVIALNNLGASLVTGRRVEEGMEYLSRAQLLAPQNPEISYNYGLALYQSGRLGDALRYVQSAADSRRQLEEPRLLLALIDIDVKDFESAEQELRQVNNHTLGAMIAGGALSLAAGHAEQAVTILKRAERIYPRNATVEYNLGVAYQQAGQLPQAKRCFAAALAAEPSFSQAKENLAILSHQ